MNASKVCHSTTKCLVLVGNDDHGGRVASRLRDRWNHLLRQEVEEEQFAGIRRWRRSTLHAVTTVMLSLGVRP